MFVIPSVIKALFSDSEGESKASQIKNLGDTNKLDIRTRGDNNSYIFNLNFDSKDKENKN